MPHETSLPLPRPTLHDEPDEAPADSRKIFTILILIGMLLIGVSMIFLWSELTAIAAPDVCLFL